MHPLLWSYSWVTLFTTEKVADVLETGKSVFSDFQDNFLAGEKRYLRLTPTVNTVLSQTFNNKIYFE